jgi:aspartate/tyrosine/aromatic aminotransferase
MVMSTAIVQYTLEGFGGGNSWGQSLAVFINTGKTYKFLGEEVVGGKFAEYTSTLKSVANNQINLITETCAEPPQGLCENPKKGKAVFVVKNGKLKGI